ncbi:Two component regulator propeller [Luteibacter sp. UNCMF331Sha3.1]|uniref:sensor histidine kinase n=1 Tax=Luteibacter sp. UNCMF331Sha3.1 TaxID=1502760 RepID=UPI0008BDEF40|nr:sensor histidine kinase [Luteibacter sp. UNCMF331Sha3.1]SEN11923.1 Two component regulator propeller [Luteibacter sp. UNCMF331Sha3.1]
MLQAKGIERVINRWLLSVAFSATLAMTASAAAQSHVTPVSLFQMQHTVVQPGGAPVGAILSLVQDSDGFLWLTTFKGRLLRFDGESLSEPFATQLKPHENPVTILLGPKGESRDMWIGHRRNGITHIVDGVATHYDGGALPKGSVQVLQRDRNGLIWAMTPSGVARFVDGRWQALPASFGPAPRHLTYFTIDAATGDVFYEDTGQGVMVSRQGSQRFVPAQRREMLHADAGLPASVPWTLPTDGEAVMRAVSDGSLWYAPETGLDRYRWSGTPHGVAPDIRERMTFADGLSSTQVYAILEDREGDVWLGTTRGLDRFRKTHVTPLVFPEPVEFPAMAALPDGSVWITTMTRAPARYADGKLETVEAVGDGISAVTALADGSLLFAGRRGLQRWRAGKLTSLPVPASFMPVGARFRQVLEDRDRTLWVVLAGSGLYHVDGDTWTAVGAREGLPSDVPTLLRQLPDGGIGVAYPDAGLYEIRHGTVRRLLGSGAAFGAPTAWLPEAQGMWIGGSRGLVHAGPKGLNTLHRPDGGAYLAVSGLVRDDDGALWIFHQDGIDWLTAADAEKAARGQPATATRHIDLVEGLGENAAGIIPVSSLLKDASGRLWAAGNTGVGYLDPRHVAFNAVRPKVFVDALATDRKVGPAVDGAVVPALTHGLRIDYTAAMLRWPERARFEYRLVGVDDGWQHAGSRRSAYYTNLSPGDYTFHVRAFNEDGVQSASDAVYRFHVAPMWYQTWMFDVGLVVVSLLLVAVAYVLRVRVVTQRLRIRTAERERIARDLHDTLLQGFQGLVLRFQVIRKHAGSDKARDMIDRALARADEVLVQGREKVAAVRRADAHTIDDGDLVRALEAVGEERSDLHPATYAVRQQGTARPLSAAVYDDVVAIAREAVLNALQHASASRVTADVVYSRGMLELRVADNGSGFDVGLEREGHWGIRGMRERARLIGAQLDLRSMPGEGSEVVLRVKASRAYR